MEQSATISTISIICMMSYGQTSYSVGAQAGVFAIHIYEQSFCVFPEFRFTLVGGSTQRWLSHSIPQFLIVDIIDMVPRVNVYDRFCYSGSVLVKHLLEFQIRSQYFSIVPKFDAVPGGNHESQVQGLCHRTLHMYSYGI